MTAKMQRLSVVRIGGTLVTSLEMRNLIFEALSEENPENTPNGNTFKVHKYRGTVADLRTIVEYIAIKHNLIEQKVAIPRLGWGSPGENPMYERNTNLTDENLDLFTEEVHILVNRNILSPGALGGYGDHLPYFHVTEYGLKCLEKRDVLPYDPDGYMNKISSIQSVDEWEKFYVEQSLKCYNADAFEAALMMIGLAGEYLATKLIEKMNDFLLNNEASLQTTYQTALQGKRVISQRYAEYENVLGRVINLKDPATNLYKYQTLRNLSPTLDGAAKAVYATYLRLTRNELAHPSGLQLDRIECLTFMTSYIKYCETQHNYLDFYVANS